MKQYITNGALGTANAAIFEYKTHTHQGRRALMLQIKNLMERTDAKTIYVEYLGDNIFDEPLETFTVTDEYATDTCLCDSGSRLPRR
jgi:hypothetical protein